VDGLGVLQASRAANPSAMVIIVTGYVSLDSAVQAVRLGAYDHLTKPFSLGQLDVVVRRVAERQALEAENRQRARRV
jgi:DNA-binding NtrC family response regulator